jgi:hypothetical protein
VIDDKTAIARADELYRETCVRLKKRPFETVGEIGFVDGVKFVSLFDSSGRLSGVYRVQEDDVVDLEGHVLTQVRIRLQESEA